MNSVKPPIPTRYTLNSLVTLATCRRRFEIEHVKNFRSLHWSDGLYPPSIKDMLRLALAKRDELLLLKGFSERQILIEMQCLINDWADDAHRSAPSLGFEAHAQLTVDIGKICKDAIGIIDHYLATWSCEEGKIVHVTRKKTRLDLCDQKVTVRLRKNGRRTKWSYVCKLNMVYDRGWLPLTRIDRPLLILRHFTSSSDVERIYQDLDNSSWWLGHALAASEMIGKRIEQVVFDVVRTVPPSMPKAIVCTRCKGVKFFADKDGVEIACPICGGTGFRRISRALCSATTRTLEVFQREYPHIKIDEGLREKLTKNELSFAWRLPLVVDWSRVEDWQRDALATIQEGVVARRAGYWPRNFKACNNPSKRCPYRGPCNRPADYINVAPYKKIESKNYDF